MDEKQRYMVLPRTLIFVFKEDKLLLMKYSGKGQSMSKEKEDRKDIYNPIGGHVEEGEDVIESAIREAKEEAGIRLLNPKIKGVVNVKGFAEKNVIMFIITGTTEDEVVKATLEGELEWVNQKDIDSLPVFPDLKYILNHLGYLKETEIFVGKAEFEGFDLKGFQFTTI